MAYTVKKLAQLSGVSIRTLHFYDEVGLLKPAYYGNNGYRFYEEPQLLKLQQILFFRELGFELEKIKKIIGRSDFDTIGSLLSHREFLQKELGRYRRLIKTIDKTIEHLKGTKVMKEKEIYKGFDPKKQKEYEQQLIDRFGEKVKETFAECERNVKNWTQADWDRSHQRFQEICKKLTQMIEHHLSTSSKEVQSVVQEHYQMLKQFWTPTKESYPEHGKLIVETDLRKPYEAYHPKLPEFLAEAMVIFAEKKLS